MDPATLGTLIPIFGIMTGMLAIWTAHQRKMASINAKTTAAMTAEKAAQYASGIQQLEDRVRVLERIVTDSGYNVSAQIEALRDTHRVENQDSGVPLDLARKEHAR